MNSRASRVTAAVIVLVLVLTGFLNFGNDTQGVALGAVLDAMNRQPWVHVKATVRQENQTQVHEEWECFNPKISISKDSAGVIDFRDYSQGTTYVYQPVKQTVTISVTPNFKKGGPQSPSEAFQELIARFESGSSSVTREKTTRGQVAVEVISMLYERQQITLVLDLERQLPIIMDVATHIPETGPEAHITVEYDYPVPGPADIYSLGVPADVRVIDNRPQGRVQDLINEVQSRFDTGYQDHIAVVLKSEVEEGNELRPMQIIVMRRQGQMKRVDRYVANLFTGRNNVEPTLYPLIKDAWPGLSVEAVVSLEDTEYADFQMIYDGTQSTQRTNFVQVRVTSKPGDGFQWVSSKSLARYAWGSPSAQMMSGSKQQVKSEILPDDPKRPGWVGFRLVASMDDAEQRSAGNTIKQRTKEYWFDPEKDYLLMERRTVTQREDSRSTTIDRTVETAQTSTGQWYPTLIRTESTFPGRKGDMIGNLYELRILLDTEPVFTEDIFDRSTLVE